MPCRRLGRRLALRLVSAAAGVMTLFAALGAAQAAGGDGAACVLQREAVLQPVSFLPRDDNQVQVSPLRPLFRSVEGLDPVEARKETLIAVLLPAIHEFNHQLLADRQFLLNVRECLRSARPLEDGARLRLAEIARDYGVVADIDALIRRVDMVPASLVIAHAIVESGWGVSCHAARPLSATEDGAVAVVAAAAAFVHALNAGGAQDGFRAKRAQMRDRLDTFDGYILASGIAEQGPEQLRVIRAAMRHNNFQSLDVPLPALPADRFDAAW